MLTEQKIQEIRKKVSDESGQWHFDTLLFAREIEKAVIDDNAQQSPAVEVPDDVKSQIYRLIETCEKFYGTDEARGTVAKWLEDSVQSPRITEQDAREIVEKIARNVPEDTNDNPMAFANEWALFVIEEAKELLNKLNGVSHE